MGWSIDNMSIHDISSTYDIIPNTNLKLNSIFRWLYDLTSC